MRRGGFRTLASGDILFHLGGAGQPDRRTVHAGLALTKVEKWLLSQWIRDGALAGASNQKPPAVDTCKA